MPEYYSIELAEKVKRGLTENALKAKANGGTCTFGYTVDSDRHYQIDPPAASSCARCSSFTPTARQ